MKVSRSAPNQIESFTYFRFSPTIAISHVLRDIKLLHVSLCETAACGWKLTPDSWSVSRQSRTSDPYTFINTVWFYDDLKCQVHPSQTAACLLSDPLVATATPPSQAPSFLCFQFQSRTKIGYLTDYSPLSFQSLPRRTGKPVQEKGCQKCRGWVFLRESNPFRSTQALAKLWCNTDTKPEGWSNGHTSPI